MTLSSRTQGPGKELGEFQVLEMQGECNHCLSMIVCEMKGGEK